MGLLKGELWTSDGRCIRKGEPMAQLIIKQDDGNIVEISDIDDKTVHLALDLALREKQYLTAGEVAGILRYKNVRSIYNLVYKRAIPFKKIGHNVRFIRTEIDNWIDCNTAQLADIRNARV